MTLDIIVSIILFLCVLMTCIPTLPGIPFMLLVTVIYGFLSHFEQLEPRHLIVFGSITLVSILIDFFSGVLGAKLGGASGKSVLAGMIGLFVGLILFPPLGAFIGLFAGVFIAELAQFRDHAQALRSAASSLVAAVAGTAANVLLAIAFFVIFLVIIL